MTHKVQGTKATETAAVKGAAGVIAPAQVKSLEGSINNQLANNDTGIDQSGVASSSWSNKTAPADCPKDAAALFNKWSAGTATGNNATLYKFNQGGHTVWGVQNADNSGKDVIVLFSGAKEVASGKINGSGTYDWAAK